MGQQRSPRGDPGWTPRPVTEADLDELKDGMNALNERVEAMSETLAWAMKEALKTAVREMLDDDKIYDAAVEKFGQALSRKGKSTAGTVLFGAAGDVWRWGVRIVFIWLVVAQLGGWKMATDLIKGLVAIKQ